MRRIAFSQHELAGAVGDLGTDLLLLMGMVVTGALNPANPLPVFGTLQMLTGLPYRLPMQQLRGGVAWRTPSA